jgi:hypothetical protein
MHAPFCGLFGLTIPSLDGRSSTPHPPRRPAARGLGGPSCRLAPGVAFPNRTCRHTPSATFGCRAAKGPWGMGRRRTKRQQGPTATGRQAARGGRAHEPRRDGPRGAGGKKNNNRTEPVSPFVSPGGFAWGYGHAHAPRTRVASGRPPRRPRRRPRPVAAPGRARPVVRTGGAPTTDVWRGRGAERTARRRTSPRAARRAKTTC